MEELKVRGTGYEHKNISFNDLCSMLINTTVKRVGNDCTFSVVDIVNDLKETVNSMQKLNVKEMIEYVLIDINGIFSYRKEDLNKGVFEKFDVYEITLSLEQTGFSIRQIELDIKERPKYQIIEVEITETRRTTAYLIEKDGEYNTCRYDEDIDNYFSSYNADWEVDEYGYDYSYETIESNLTKEEAELEMCNYDCCNERHFEFEREDEENE